MRELVEIAREEMVHTRVRIDAPLVSDFAYTDAMHAARYLTEAREPRVLCLGGGGCIVPQQLLVGGGAHERVAHVDVVENARDVIEMARAYFLVVEESPRFVLHCADAATFLRHECAADAYDIVLIDLFGAFQASPLLAQTLFFDHVARVTRPGGAIAVNTVGPLDGTNGAMLATMQAMHLSAFRGSIVTVPMLAAHEREAHSLSLSAPRNVVTFATRGRLPTALFHHEHHDDDGAAELASSPPPRASRAVQRPAPSASPSPSPSLPHLDETLMDLNRQLHALSVATEASANGTLMPLVA